MCKIRIVLLRISQERYGEMLKEGYVKGTNLRKTEKIWKREKSREGRRNFSRSVPFLVVRSFTFFLPALRISWIHFQRRSRRRGPSSSGLRFCRAEGKANTARRSRATEVDAYVHTRQRRRRWRRRRRARERISFCSLCGGGRTL